MIGDPRQVDSATTVKVSSFALAAGDTLILSANPDRIAVIFCGNSNSFVYVAPKKMTADAQGIFIGQNTPGVFISMTQFAGLPCKEWHAWTSAGLGPTVEVTEIIYQPWLVSQYERGQDGQGGIDATPQE